MSFVVRTRDNFVKDTYARVGAFWEPGRVETPGYMCAESEWGSVNRRPVFRVLWCDDPEEATRFPTEEAAWAVFDKSGHGRREDYRTEQIDI